MFDYFSKEKSDFLKKKDKSKKGCVDKDIKEIVDEINSKKDYYTTSSCSGRIVLLEMKSKRKDECNWIFSKHDKVKFNEINNALKQYNKINLKTRERPLKAGKKEETSFGSLPIGSQFIGEPEACGKTACDMRVNEANSLTTHSSTKYCERSERIESKSSKQKNLINPIWFKQQPIILHVACRNLDAAKRLLDIARRVFKHSGILSITDRKTTIEIIGNERIDTIIADRDFAADEKYIKQLVKYANHNFGENKKRSRKLFEISKTF